MTTSATKRYRFVGPHIGDRADGRILEPGEFYDLTAAEVDHPHTQMHLESGHLIEAPHQTKQKDGDAA